MDKTLKQLTERRRRDTLFLFKTTARSEDVLDYPYLLLHNLDLPLTRIIDLENSDSLEQTLSLASSTNMLKTRIISSAHFLVSSYTLRYGRLKPSEWVNYSIRDFPSLVETLRVLKPRKFFWFPHDLSEPFVREDIPFLPLADCIFTVNRDMDQKVRGIAKKTQIVGWPRINKNNSLAANYGPVWFITFFQRIQERWSPDEFANIVSPLIKLQVLFKFPAWTNTSVYETAIEKTGGSCISIDKVSLDVLLQSQLPIISAGSSMELEAEFAGKPYIRFHFPLHISDSSDDKPIASCTNIQDLIGVLKQTHLSVKKADVLCFDEEIYLREILQDL
jgi:hypothetical protein